MPSTVRRSLCVCMYCTVVVHVMYLVLRLVSEFGSISVRVW
jgi:hypothetical protein